MIHETQTLVNKRLTQSPNYEPYKHTATQLEIILDQATRQHIPTLDEYKKIDLGIMCAKTLEQKDPELADLIYKVLEIYDKIVV